MNLNLNQWIDFPYEVAIGDSVDSRYLYVVGGYHGIDNGCPPWGSNNPYNIRMIGDKAGKIRVQYGDGTTDVFPLIFGYTLWWHSIWAEKPAPFFGEEMDPALVDKLQAALYVKGAWEGSELGVIRLELAGKKVVGVCVQGEDGRNGGPLFVGGYLADDTLDILRGGAVEVDARDPFFAAHTVKRADMYPQVHEQALADIGFALHTFEKDFQEAPETFDFPEKVDSYTHFTGSRLAEIATGVVYHNMKNLRARTDEDGFIHTSYLDAPSWRYDGFGPYVAKANSYYGAYYSRDCARAIMTLNGFGDREKAEAGCGFGNRWMMYYPENALKICGVPVPGHFSVMVNQPMVYSTFLAPEAGWPTRYTEEKFGEGYQNLGNQETDGHGLMMLANYQVWKNLGSRVEWVEENWRYIREAAEWIVWCFAHPEISFAENDLLYGETEAAMNTYTLYSNVPCCLAMEGYAQMAEAAGQAEAAQSWRGCAERIRRGIEKGLTDGDGWLMKKFGFYHDPVVTMMADVYGYDVADMPQNWVERSRAVYGKDRLDAAERGFFGARGIGYDHSMITQNALLLDQMEDGGRFMESLAKLSYAPRLPESYLVPEAISADHEKGVIRRQGDLGNLVQQAEAMKCCLIVQGISPVQDGRLKLMPRLPKGWGLDVKDFPVQNAEAKVSMQVAYPCGNRQSAWVKAEGAGVEKITFRFGPFPMNTQMAEITLNGQSRTVETYESGDSRWAFVEV